MLTAGFHNCYAADAYAHRPAGFTAQQTGSEESTARVARGGGWLDVTTSVLDSTHRGHQLARYRDAGVGFRCALGGH